MAEEINVILDLSPSVQDLLNEQGVDLYDEIQRALPSVHLKKLADPEAPKGSRDIVTIIAVTSTLISSLTPIILRILNIITPPDRTQTWTIEELETRHHDGSITIQRKRVLSKSEQRPYQQQTTDRLKDTKKKGKETGE
jgi:hypothetical protein